MSVLIQITDFIGKYAISTFETTEVQQLLDEEETKWINNLLGVAEATLFLADANANGGVPVIPQYLIIYNALQLDNCHSDFENYSTGIKLMLINAIYAEWYGQENVQGTSIGLKVIESTNADTVPGYTFKLKNNLNEAIGNYKVIQNYICMNSSDYPDYAGVTKNYVSPF